MVDLEPDEDGIIDARPEAVREAEEHDDSIDQPFVYRGAGIKMLNRNEFANNSIRGNVFDVWEGTMEPVPDRKEAFATAVDDLPWQQVDRVDYPVTGGVTTRIGAGIFFAGSQGDPHVTLYLRTDDITTTVKAIEYTLSWFDRNPGALAHVETLADGEIWANGELTGLAKQDPNKPPHVETWGRENVSHRATSPTYEEEYEAVAEAGEIDLDSALAGAASWFQIDGPTRNTLDEALTTLPGYDMTRSFGKETEIVEFMDPEEKARHLHDEYTDLLHYTPDDYWVLVHARKPRLQKATERVGAEMFEFGYDGSSIVRDIDAVPNYLLGGA